MPRTPRVSIPGFSYHVTHRGNRKQDVFLSDVDRRVYLKLLAEYSQGELAILAYCLMTNHVHLIVVPGYEDSLSRVIQRVHGEFAKYHNITYSNDGHLWQGRFKSAVLSESHLWNAVRYVERNSVRAGLVRCAEEFEWSSAPAHCGLREDSSLTGDLHFSEDIKDWRAWLAGEEPKEYLRLIRERTHLGKPIGDDAFVREIKARSGKGV